LKLEEICAQWESEVQPAAVVALFWMQGILMFQKIGAAPRPLRHVNSAALTAPHEKAAVLVRSPRELGLLIRLL
jgi:hypothetical protein